MEKKKSEKADLNAKRSTFFLIGMAATLLIVLGAFKWNSAEGDTANLGELHEETEQIEIPPTDQKVKPPPPPPPPVIKVIEDSDLLDEEEDIIDETEVDEDTEIDIPDVEPVDDVDEEQVFMVVEQMPTYPGGEAAMFKYLQKNVVYPTLARESGVTGIVHVYFVVDQNGKVTQAKVLRGLPAGCDDEALRVVKAMPKWTPGMQRGKPVKVQYTIPINFKLR